jgi:hypothetical protein
MPGVAFVSPGLAKIEHDGVRNRFTPFGIMFGLW